MELRNRILQRRGGLRARPPRQPTHMTLHRSLGGKPQIEFAQLINSPPLLTAAAAAVPWPSRPSPTTVALLSAAVAAVAAAAGLALGLRPRSHCCLN